MFNSGASKSGSPTSSAEAFTRVSRGAGLARTPGTIASRAAARVMTMNLESFIFDNLSG